ncbi:NUDIX domain-containing protein [Bacillus luteolus]|uniref:NUDIX domain-containing protein n=1 Tax=Litchfieldia luteola TaxID=682179 RepID=A0ABR9QMX3_9BACI|nr:NUDIX domain-containing protein [Cytobacillus luteolus]MBE4909865.1 NUDIX domain-containing protein [Cytobacillus luteolus]MBP1942585.1 ADP-ribose pyrophosphatase YjhB (NUDIX family) [Cytobacillus luteolus]
MIYRRKTYKIKPEKLNDFNQFFHSYLYPNQIKHGAKLIGRWVNEDKDEILAIWEYKSIEHYEGIENLIRNSELHQKAKEKRMEIGELYIENNQDFLTSTASPATYHPPKHIVSVSGYITNEEGKVLLVRNFHRSDTMEMPGGQVEEGETLEEAIHREILEETGVKVQLQGITGIYQNITNGVICVVFRGHYESGEIRTAEGETSEVFFTELTKERINELITRPHFRSRTLDAMEPNYLPYEAFKAIPYELIKRFEVKKEFSS